MDFSLNIMETVFNKFRLKYNFITQDRFDKFIVSIIKRQGVLFIKLCQILSSSKKAKKILGDNLFNLLTDLQDRCNQTEFKKLDYIDYIYDRPIASGSICQIFRINHKNEICVMKILIDNIDKKIESSFSNLVTLKNYCYYFKQSYYELFKIIDMDKYYLFIKKQTNLSNEASNTIYFSQIFNHIDKIIIPKIYYYDKTKIIMEELKLQYKINEIETKFPHLFNEALYLILGYIYIGIKNGIIHSDLHWGNYNFMVENGNIKLIVLDYGIVTYIDDYDKTFLLDMVDILIPLDMKKYKLKKFLERKDIKLKGDIDILETKINDKNIFDIFDMKNIPVEYINILLSFSSINKLINRECDNSKIALNTKRKLSFIVHFFNYIYKNNFV